MTEQEHSTDIVVRTTDGRQLVGRSAGPSTGGPVLFVAGAGTGKTMIFGEDLLGGAGIRLITMDRPGMGGSTTDPDRDLRSTVADYRTFVDGVLGVADAVVPVVGNSQGSVFALALAQAGAAERLLLISPADEVAHPPVRDQLPPEVAGFTALATSSPEEFQDMLRGFTAERMEEMVLAGSPAVDREFYSAEPFRTQYRASLSEGFANDAAGYVRDTLLASRGWGLDLAGIHCPVYIAFGAADGSHSPDLGVTLAGRIPGAVREVVPDAGGSLLWTHAADVLSRLACGAVTL